MLQRICRSSCSLHGMQGPAELRPRPAACRRLHTSQIVCMGAALQPSISGPSEALGKKDLVRDLLAAKESSGKSFTQISKEIGMTNCYAAQLFYNQAQLKEGTVDKLRKAVPALTDEHVKLMKRCPFRSYDPAIEREPHIYRMKEAVLHYGEALKALLNEELGDGIMSAIDVYLAADVVEGVQGEKRFVITLNGKFLPHIEQPIEENTATIPNSKLK